MKFYGASDVGLMRKSNQDSFLLTKNEQGTVLALICDGIGGGKAGDVASKIATDYLAQCFKIANQLETDAQIREWIKMSIIHANDLIFTQSTSSNSQRGMGTTLVGALIGEVGTYVFNVGDSRLYAYYNELICMTTDHNLVNDLIKSGELSVEDAQNHPQKNLLTNALGIWDKVRIDINKIKDEYRYLLICSDGLHSYVSQDKITRILTNESSVENKVSSLIDLSKLVGGFDNVSVIVIEK
ncbi:MAG: Stp1/IreP family PP2C-type Ser/Thr phosphatase [Erysipelotrichaceae bacterium]